MRKGPGPIIATAYLPTAEAAEMAARLALAGGASRAEIRLDALASEEERLKAAELSSRIPLLLSGDRIRTRPEEWRHLERASELGAWVDVPFQGAPQELPSRINLSRLILSWHGKKGEKADLHALIAAMRERKAAACKLVPFAEDERAVLDARDVLLRYGKRDDLILFASGAASVASRLLAIAWGSLATYASAPGCAPAGEGQPPLGLLLSCAPLEIGPSSPLIALLGWPLAYSRTPSFFNRWLKEAGRPERYIIFPTESLERFEPVAAKLNISGAAVTIPHKEGAIKRAAFVSRLAGAVGAANTLLSRDGGWMAANTDAFGVRSAVRGWTAPPNRCVLILGAGGAAAAAAMALRSIGRVAICARDHAKAARLASRLGCETLPWNERSKARWDLLVNATPLGTIGGECPMSGVRLAGKALLDMVVLPEGETPLVEKARREGLRIFPAEVMLMAQAARLEYNSRGAER